MKSRNLKFDVEGFDGGIESRRLGDRIEIAYQGMPVMAFAVSDPTARDWTIASLLEVPLKGKTIAPLCGVSPATVSNVRKLLRQGGHEALVHPPMGRPATALTGVRLLRAIDMRKRGATHAEIGKAFGISKGTSHRLLRSIPRGRRERQVVLGGVGAAPPDSTAASSSTTTEPSSSTSSDSASASNPVAPPPVEGEAPVSDAEPSVERESSHDDEEEPEELIPAMPLPVDPAEHPCRYAGTLLIVAAAQVLGLGSALNAAGVSRPESSWYSAWNAVVALLSAWSAGFGSLEAMHERDARALGVVLGFERSPCVRTLHLAIGQMVSRFDPISLSTALLRGLFRAVGQVPRVFGIDGHFKGYFGDEPIDKGWDTKRRMAHRGIADVLVHDEQGRIWKGAQVGAGDHLTEHVLSSAKELHGTLGRDEKIVMAFDRGGFAFEVLESLDREQFGYVAWVPSSVSLPDLSSIAPDDDGVGEVLWDHPKLGEGHSARLLVQRDGTALVPAVTNLGAETTAEQALKMLRKVRGWQENDIKAARSFAHIDRLVDRGGATRRCDDRPVDNPEHREKAARRRELRGQLAELDRHRPTGAADMVSWGGERMMAEFEEDLLSHQLKDIPAKVPRNELEPEAQRARLKTRNRSLLQPLKYVLANSRRWLLNALGASLAPSDAEWDATAVDRTLEALVRAPGTVRFGRRRVEVTLELPLPPTPHERLARGLESLDDKGLRFSDEQRSVVFRLAPRPTRDTLPAVAELPWWARKNSRS